MSKQETLSVMYKGIKGFIKSQGCHAQSEEIFHMSRVFSLIFISHSYRYIFLKNKRKLRESQIVWKFCEEYSTK